MESASHSFRARLLWRTDPRGFALAFCALAVIGIVLRIVRSLVSTSLGSGLLWHVLIFSLGFVPSMLFVEALLRVTARVRTRSLDLSGLAYTRSIAVDDILRVDSYRGRRDGVRITLRSGAHLTLLAPSVDVSRGTLLSALRDLTAGTG